MNIYAGRMTDSRRAEREDAAEQLKASTARRERDRSLTMSERLERVHQLSAQMAKLEPVRHKRQP